MNPLHKISFIFMPIQGCCKHIDEDYDDQPCFRFRKRWIWLPYMMMSLLLVALVKSCLDGHIKFKSNISDDMDRTDCVIFMQQFICVLAFMLMYTIVLVRSKRRIFFLNKTLKLFTHPANAEFINFRSCSRIFHIKIIVAIVLIVTNFIFVFIINGMNYIYENISLGICLFATICMVVQTINELQILLLFRQDIDTSLMNHMKSIMDNGGIRVVTGERQPVITLKEKLKRMEIFYIDYHECIKHLNLFLGPLLVVWNLSTIIQLVLDVYIFLLLSNKMATGMNILEHLRSYTRIFGIIVLLNRGEKASAVSDRTLSFLFKYPITKLSQDEAYQVEMLMYTLSTHRPSIKASDIFTVGTKLLSSISGAVVTYVLVALQFRPAWIQ